MENILRIYNKTPGTKDILEKYEMTTNFKNIDECMFKEYDTDDPYIGPSTMETLWKSNLYLYDNIIIPVDDYNNKLDKHLKI
jgi:hypothetical protein